MRHLAIFGAGGHGKVVASIALASGWDDISFYDDSDLQSVGQWKVIGGFKRLLNDHARYQGVIIAVGDNHIRWSKHCLLRDAGSNIVSVIHPFSAISEFVTLGPGSVVMPGAVINIGSTLGQACIVNTGATIDHDCQIHEAVHICPGAHLAGGVIVEQYSQLGIGSLVCQMVHIGENVMLGAGTVVIDNVEANSKMVGNPARLIGWA